jgi:hypothetical protein
MKARAKQPYGGHGHVRPSGTERAGATRSRRAGNAMLELILILPLYMLLLFVVCALSEFGQVSTQVYQSARMAAWHKRSPNDEAPQEFDWKSQAQADSFRHFGPRVVVKGGSGKMLAPLDEDGSTGAGVSLSTGGLVKAGAHAYQHYVLANPLYPVDGLYADDAPAANLAGICRMAMRGSDVPPHNESVPWLRRHYSSVWVTYKAFGGVFGLQRQLRSFHTVLRTSTWAAQNHAPYDFAEHPNRLRDPAAYPYDDVVNLELHNHQMDLLGRQADFEPDMP